MQLSDADGGSRFNKSSLKNELTQLAKNIN
jgi:hypothetical protein